MLPYVNGTTGANNICYLVRLLPESRAHFEPEATRCESWIKKCLPPNGSAPLMGPPRSRLASKGSLVSL